MARAGDYYSGENDDDDNDLEPEWFGGDRLNDDKTGKTSRTWHFVGRYHWERFVMRYVGSSTCTRPDAWT